ncbi:MAG: acylphosphatase [Parafilimonas terrae]|nr:acylphosphatase [Parafilimonas terrae]
MGEVRTVSVIIRGRVQGVSYRAWTKETAVGLGLSGSVRNRPDRSVEAVFSGPPDVVEQMLARCRKGPLLARVDDIAVTEGVSAPASQDFVIERS